MLNEFSIENFKVFKEFELKNLKKVNFFVGAPNTGKTSILEALSLFLAKNPQTLLLLLEARAMVNSESFESLFFDYDVNKPIILKSGSNQLDISPKSQDKELILQTDKLNLNSSYLLQAVNSLAFSFKQDNEKHILSNIAFDQAGNVINFRLSANENVKTLSDNAEFICGIANRQFYTRFLDNLNNIIADKNKNEDFQKKIKEFSKNIEEIKFGNAQVLVQQIHTQHAIDLRLFGQGFRSYVFILAAILSGKKYIIIDEIENGLHFESIDLLLKAILNSPKDVQFFITTHNEEILKRLARLLEEKDDIVSAFNIYYDEEKQLQAIQYSQEKLIFAMDNDNEIRW